MLRFQGARTWFRRLSMRFVSERGATAVEYALMVALIAAVIITAVTLLGGNTGSAFGNYNTKFASAAS